jgi:DNA repair exonuclease SbcCD nuclease subunit
MRLLCIGDTHFKIDNFIDTRDFCTKVLSKLAEMPVDLVVLLGDLVHYHEKIYTECLNQVCNFIKDLRKYAPVVILVGNHDMTNNSGFLQPNHWMNSLKEWDGVTIVDTVIEKSIDNNKMLFCPYVPPGRFVEALSTIPDWQAASVILAHQEFYGAKMGAFVSEIGDKWENEYPPVISGHIHDKQRLGNIYYAGSAIQVSHKDAANKTVTLVDLTSSLSITEINLCLRQKKTIYTSVSMLNTEQIDTDVTKISVSGNYDEFKQFKKTKAYKDILKNNIRIVYKQREKVPLPTREKHTLPFEDILINILSDDIDLLDIYKSFLTDDILLV